MAGPEAVDRFKERIRGLTAQRGHEIVDKTYAFAQDLALAPERIPSVVALEITASW